MTLPDVRAGATSYSRPRKDSLAAAHTDNAASADGAFQMMRGCVTRNPLIADQDDTYAVVECAYRQQFREEKNVDFKS
jgi:hypothetical protein